MDKKYGRNERRFNTGGEKRRYQRSGAERPFRSIDDYLSDRDKKFGKTADLPPGVGKTAGRDRSKLRLARDGGGEETGSFRRNPNGDPGNREERREERRNDRRKGGGRRRANTQRQAAEETRETPETADRAEGRNAVQEAFRSGHSVDKLYVQKDLQDGPIQSILRLAKKNKTVVKYVEKERLDQMSRTGKHQGVIAQTAVYQYAEVEDILERAKQKGEDPFLILLDGIEDPYNLGAIIRTANMAGAHGVVITKHRAARLTAAVARSSAGALNYTPVAKVPNLGSLIDKLKQDGMWFVCADMNGTNMYDLAMKGSVGLVIGNEGSGVSRLVREKCDFTASIPTCGDIDSLNASVAAGILSFEIARQRRL